MNSRPIGFFDSGVGGLPYLACAKQHLPRESFVYLGDSAHFPYGEKSAAEIRDYVLRGIALLSKVNEPKMIVVACNTASVVALGELRARFNIPFVGVVPAVKTAANGSKCRRIALFATAKTVGDPYTDDLIKNSAADCAVVRVAGGPLVHFVESEFDPRNPAPVKAVLSPYIAEFKSQGVDAVVLGCTHFSLLDAEIRAELGDGTDVVDAREGVVKQIERILERDGLSSTTPCGDSFYHTGGSAERYRMFAACFGLQYRGIAA